MSGPSNTKHFPEEPMQEQMVEDLPQVTAHMEVEASGQPFPNFSNMTPGQWFSTAAWVVGALVIVACFVRFTPFSKGVSDLFTTLANISKGNGKKK